MKICHCGESVFEYQGTIYSCAPAYRESAWTPEQSSSSSRSHVFRQLRTTSTQIYHEHVCPSEFQEGKSGKRSRPRK
jgi:hypothetical protein